MGRRRDGVTVLFPVQRGIDGFAPLIVQALAALRQRRPGIRISLVDVEPPPAAGLHRQLLFRDPLRLVLPRGHRFAGSAQVAIFDLRDDDWISGGPGVPNRLCLDSLAAVHVAYETADYEVTLALVAAGLGVSLVPASLLGRHGAVIVRNLRSPTPEREVYVVHARRPPPAGPGRRARHPAPAVTHPRVVGVSWHWA
jgi:DNA-binding transcriptional LysR family regulator